MGSTLSHSDTDIVSREQLSLIETPMGTETFKPIPHLELIVTLEKALYRRGVSVIREQFSIRRDGSRIFGTMDLNLKGVPGSCASLGFRTSNDKSLSIQIVAGVRVFVCDNLALNGDFIALKRKHTSGLNLLDEITIAVTKFESHYITLREEISGLQQKQLSDLEAKGLIHDVFAAQIMPVRFFPQVSHEYFEPRHDEFKPRNAWSLHNAFTETAKEMPITSRMDATQEVGRYFGLVSKN